MKPSRLLFLPFSILYGLLTWLRNKFFDWGILPSQSYETPVISVGNLAVGGVGKTPLIEYLVNLLLSENETVATLSRGYKRKTSGFVHAGENETVKTIGDEALQYKNKFKEKPVHVTVCEKRRVGIEKIEQDLSDTSVILLDDAFQHRYVNPGLSILLTEYHNLYTKDFLMPVGRLRESARGRKRADIIVVTKTPQIFSPIERRQITKDLKLKKYQKIFFSYIDYQDFQPVYDNSGESCALPEAVNHITLVAGIANTKPLEEYLKRKSSVVKVHKFPDHHQFTKHELENIKNEFEAEFTKKKIIVTTEKDMMRLQSDEIKKLLKDLPFFYLPIKFDFHKQAKHLFDETIISYVSAAKKNKS